MADPVLVFDVNETLSDMRPVADVFVRAGAGAEVAATWFAALLRDGFAAAAAGGLVRFADVGRDRAGALLADVVPQDDARRLVVEEVMAAFTGLDLHPDVDPGVRALAGAGVRMVTLSNGAATVAEGLLVRAGLRDAVEHVLSVEDAGVWKPAAGAYHHAARVCGVAPSDLVMVAVHPWDLHGAAAAGLRTAWVNRPAVGPALRHYPAYFTAPDRVVAGVGDLLGVVSPRYGADPAAG